MTPGFADSYHHARRAYGAVAALLLAWEFVGITILEPEATSFPATLKNPEAAPIVLTALVVYFAVRFTLEWHQLDASLRNSSVSRIDYYLGHAIGLGSFLVYAVQQLFVVRIADLVKPAVAASFLLSTVSGFAASEIARYVRERQTDRLRLSMFIVTAIAIIPLALALAGLSRGTVLAVAAGFGLGFGIGYLVGRIRKSYGTPRSPERPVVP